MEQNLKYARDILTNSSTQYELGVNIDLSVCEGSRSTLNNYFQQMLPFLDYVYFDLVPKQEDVYVGVDIAVPNFIIRMKTCTQKMQRLMSNLTVGYRMSWPDTDTNGNQNISALVRFWEKMNFFASNSNVSLTLSEAFDVPYFKLPYKTQGRWRLNQNMT